MRYYLSTRKMQSSTDPVLALALFHLNQTEAARRRHAGDTIHRDCR